MKNITFTYDTVENGEHGEACLTLPMFEDDRALRIQQIATMHPMDVKGCDYELYALCHAVICAAETMRGRSYTYGSVKTVELEDAKA